MRLITTAALCALAGAFSGPRPRTPRAVTLGAATLDASDETVRRRLVLRRRRPEHATSHHTPQHAFADPIHPRRPRSRLPVVGRYVAYVAELRRSRAELEARSG